MNDAFEKLKNIPVHERTPIEALIVEAENSALGEYCPYAAEIITSMYVELATLRTENLNLKKTKCHFTIENPSN